MLQGRNHGSVLTVRIQQITQIPNIFLLTNELIQINIKHFLIFIFRVLIVTKQPLTFPTVSHKRKSKCQLIFIPNDNIRFIQINIKYFFIFIFRVLIVTKQPLTFPQFHTKENPSVN